MSDIIRKFTSKYGIIIILVLLFAFFSFTSSAFLSSTNLINIARQMAMLGISAVGMTFVMLTGGIDLSVGSIISLTGIVTAISMVTLHLNMIIAILLGLAVAVIVGLINGIAVTKFKIPALITTLGTMTSVRGLSFIFTGGMPVFGFPNSFNVFGRGSIVGVPIPVIIMTVIFFIGWITLNRTKYGRYLYAIGGNDEAARLSGINVPKNLLLAYLFSGLLTGIAGIIMLSRVNSGQPTTGTGFEMDVITAVVLGGINIAGGEGNFIGFIYGILIIGVLSNGMVLLNVYDYYQMLIKGLVLLFAVGIDKYYKNKKYIERIQQSEVL